MRILLIVGLLLLALGVASLFVPIPHTHNNGVKIGGAEIGVQTRTSERIPLAASIVMMAGGIVLAAIGGRGRG